MLLLFIKESNISDMDKEFLMLQLEDIIRAGLGNSIDFESEQTAYINDLSISFWINIPIVLRNDHSRETIRYKFEPSPWAFYWDMIGLGAVVPTGNLSDYFVRCRRRDGFGFTI